MVAPSKARQEWMRSVGTRGALENVAPPPDRILGLTPSSVCPSPFQASGYSQVQSSPRPFAHFPLGRCDLSWSVSREAVNRDAPGDWTRVTLSPALWRSPVCRWRSEMIHLHGSFAAELDQEEGTHTQLLRAAMSRAGEFRPPPTKPVRRYPGLGTWTRELLNCHLDVIRAGHGMQLGRRRGRVWRDTVDLWQSPHDPDIPQDHRSARKHGNERAIRALHRP